MSPRDPVEKTLTEELRRKLATEDRLPPECIDREIIKVLELVIEDLEAKRFRLERSIRIPLEERGTKDPDRVIAKVLACKVERAAH